MTTRCAYPRCCKLAQRGSAYCTRTCRVSHARQKNVQLAKQAKACPVCSGGLAGVTLRLLCRCGAEQDVHPGGIVWGPHDVAAEMKAFTEKHGGCANGATEP